MKTVARDLAGLNGLQVQDAIPGRNMEDEAGIDQIVAGWGKDWRYPMTGKFRA